MITSPYKNLNELLEAHDLQRQKRQDILAPDVSLDDLGIHPRGAVAWRTHDPEGNVMGEGVANNLITAWGKGGLLLIHYGFDRPKTESMSNQVYKLSSPAEASMPSLAGLNQD